MVNEQLQSNLEEAPIKWGDYASPFRPSPGDIESYLVVLKRLEKKEKILFLGTTPELQDLFSKLNLSITVADSSPQMLQGMLSLCYQADIVKEKWIKADWLDLDKFLRNDYFDLIVGDLVLRNIESGDQDKFLKKISKLLSQEGFFVSRIHFISEELIESDPNKIIRIVFDEHAGQIDKILEDLIASRLFDRNTNSKTKKINKEIFIADINQYIKNRSRGKKEKAILNNVLKKWSSQKSWTQQKIKEIDKALSNNFIIRDIRISPDYQDSAFYPLYVLKKKNT